MATIRNSWGNRSSPDSPHTASSIPGEQEAAKAAVVDEVALLSEDLCAASLQQGANRFSADRFVPQWRLAGSFASGSRSASAPPSRRLPVSDGELAALQIRLQLTEAQERTSHVQLKIEQAHVVQQQQQRHEANLSALSLEEAHAHVRQLEVCSKETELIIKERELEWASRKAVLAGLQMEHSKRQLHLQGDVAAVHQAADAAQFNAQKQHHEQQQQQASEAPLP